MYLEPLEPLEPHNGSFLARQCPPRPCLPGHLVCSETFRPHPVPPIRRSPVVLLLYNLCFSLSQKVCHIRAQAALSSLTGTSFLSCRLCLRLARPKVCLPKLSAPAFAGSVDPHNLTQAAASRLIVLHISRAGVRFWTNKGRLGLQNMPALAYNAAYYPGLTCMIEARPHPVSTSPDSSLSCPSLRP